MPSWMLSMPWFEKNDGAGSGSEDTGDGSGDSGQGASDFTSWLNAQPDDVKTVVQPLFDAQIQKLTNTVKATREERDTLTQQLRDASKKLDEGSDQRVELEKLATQLEESGRKSSFYEEAIGQKCLNPKATYALATAENLFDSKGRPDWKAIAETAPQLFGEAVSRNPRKPKNTSGAGSSGAQGAGSQSISDWIRNQAGVRTSTE